MKKHWIVWLALSLMLTTLIVGNIYVGAASENGISYTCENGEATVTDYYGAATEVVVPSTLGGCPVTAIGQKAFQNHNYLSSVTLPDSVTTIGNYAFSSCPNLRYRSIHQAN